MSWGHGNCYGLSNVWHLPVSHIASQNHPRTAYLIWISRSSAINAGYRNHLCTCTHGNWIQIVKYNWVLSILFYTDSKSFKILIGVSFPKMFNVMHENSIIELLLITRHFIAYYRIQIHVHQTLFEFVHSLIYSYIQISSMF